MLGLVSLLTASLVFQCSFGAGKAGPEKVPTIRTSVFGAACVCWGSDVVGQGAALELDGQAEVLQGSWGIPVVGQPDVMVQEGYLGECYALPGSGHGASFLG